jgi:hypothetical protein
MRNATAERVRELGNRPAGGGKRGQNGKEMLFGRNEAKELLKIKELDFPTDQNELPFQGKKHPPKPITQRKIHHLWGISLSARPPMNRYILDGSSASQGGLGARSLQLFSRYPPSQQRRKSGIGLASRMLQDRLRGVYTARRGALRGKTMQDLSSLGRAHGRRSSGGGDAAGGRPGRQRNGEGAAGGGEKKSGRRGES